jgi:DNA modification methylase
MKQYINDKMALYNGDCVQVIKQLPNESVHFQIFSPPFANLYIYSDDLADMGNCKNSDEFFIQFDFLIPELYRVLKPGRLCAVHCKDLVKYKNRDGMAGIYDFSGDIIKHFEKFRFQYHSRITIWKDPVTEMQRTKAHGLLWKQLRKDSTFSRMGMPDYILLFRKWADDEEIIEPVTHTMEDFPVRKWQQYASPVWEYESTPVWWDIQQTNVLNVKSAKDDKDEKHICPLQLDVIERLIELYSNPDDVVFTPFLGIGSEAYVALKMGRKAIGVELKESYFNQAVTYCKDITNNDQISFFK